MVDGRHEPSSRVAFFTFGPAPYRDQLFSELARSTELRVYYVSSAAEDRPWRTREYCPTERLRSILKIPSFGDVQLGVLKAVRRADVVVVGGYEHFTYAFAMTVARLTGRRVILVFDGIAPSRLNRSGFREVVKRMLVRLAHLALVNGETGRRYFEDNLRYPSTRVRNQYLVPTPPPEGVREHPDPVDLLYVGRLVERKGIRTLLKAIEYLPEAHLTIAGSGEQLSVLQAMAEGRPVEFAGELDRDGVEAFMRAARCLVVPSQDEPWGLVVQEALQAGLAVVASSNMGCVADLIRTGENGYLFTPDDSVGLANAIAAALTLDPHTQEVANAEILQQWNLEAYRNAFAGALEI